VFVVSGNRLICYDAVPSRDLDGDGRADDGILDYERGESFDKVWQVDSRRAVVAACGGGDPARVASGGAGRQPGAGLLGAAARSQGRIPEVGRQVWSVDSPVPRFHAHDRGRANPRANRD
jgi:hypothetical protein